MWFLFAQRAPENPIKALNPSFDPVEFPKPVAVGDRFDFNLGKLTRAIVIEVSQSPELLADLNQQLAIKGRHTIDAVVIWTEDQK
jgi:acyl dehydratase